MCRSATRNSSGNGCRTRSQRCLRHGLKISSNLFTAPCPLTAALRWLIIHIPSPAVSVVDWEVVEVAGAASVPAVGVAGCRATGAISVMSFLVVVVLVLIPVARWLLVVAQGALPGWAS